MISDGCATPMARFWSSASARACCQRPKTCCLWRPGLPAPAPDTGNGHVDLRGHLIPGQVLVTQLKDLLCGGMIGRDTRTGARVRDSAYPPDWSMRNGPSEFAHWRPYTRQSTRTGPPTAPTGAALSGPRG